MCEVLACAFLLDLVRNHNIDGTSALERHLWNTLGIGRQQDMHKLIEALEEKGGHKQLIMFIIGLAGTGKSTGISVAQRFFILNSARQHQSSGRITYSSSLHTWDLQHRLLRDLLRLQPHS